MSSCSQEPNSSEGIGRGGGGGKKGRGPTKGELVFPLPNLKNRKLRRTGVGPTSAVKNGSQEKKSALGGCQGGFMQQAFWTKNSGRKKNEWV